MADLQDLYEQAGATHNIDPQLLQAVAKVESGERTTDAHGNVVTSPAGAQGIMQFIPSTARRYGVNVADPGSSINGAASYLSDLLHQTGGDVPKALALYNGSPGDRNQTYAKQVLAKYQGGGDRQVVQTAGPPEDTADFDKLFGKSTVAPPPGPDRPGQAPGTVAADQPEGTLDTLFAPQQPQQQGDQPGWFRRNIGSPARDIFNPQLPQEQEGDNSLFGVPALQRTAAGLMAGGRDIAQGLVHAGNWVTNEVGIPVNPTLQAIESKLAEQNDAFEQRHPDLWSAVSRVGGELLAGYPFTRLAEPIVGAMPAIPGVSPAVPRIANAVTSGAAAGGIQNVLTAQSQGQDPGNALLEGVTGGAALGGLTGGTSALLARSNTVQRLADQLGIRLSTGQRLGGTWQRIEDTMAPLPASGARKFAGQQRGDISAFIDRELGGNGERNLTSDNLADHEIRIGGDINNAASRITITAPPGGSTFLTDLQNIVDNAHVQGPQTSGPALDRIQNQILSILRANRGTMPGPEFARFISRGNMLDAAINSADPNIAQSARAVREALMNAAQNSPGAPADALNALREARYQWKVLKTVQPAIERVSGGTEEMSLPKLAQSIYTNPYTRRTDRLYGLMQLLGSTKGLATSGTAERSLWQKILLGSELTGIGGVGLYAAENPQQAEHYATEYGPALAVPFLGARALRFGPGMGSNLLRGTQRAFNPLLPRLGAGYVGGLAGQLGGQQQQ